VLGWTLALLAGWGLSGCNEELPTKPQASSQPVAPLSGVTATTTPHQHAAGKRVLLVHSYHPGYPWVDTVTRGVQEVADNHRIRLQIEYMDTKRHTDEQFKIESGNRMKAKVAEYRPDLVVAVDDDAQQFFAKSYVSRSLPVVFTGVDADPSKYGYPAANVTGVIERPHFKESLALARQLRSFKRIAVMSCRDSTSIAALGFMKQEQLDVEVAEWLLVDDFDQWKGAVERLNAEVEAIVIRSYQAVKKPGSATNVDPKEVVAWTSTNARVPTIAFHDFEIMEGLLVGVVKSGEAYGRQTMDCAVQILLGASPRDIPVSRAKLGTKMVNRDTAGRLGITLPSEVLTGVNLVPER
jgi:ABC-type uncharacterized transport system substrate-binding protein